MRVEYYLDQAAYSPGVHGPILHVDSLHALVLLGSTHEDANILLNSATFSDSEAQATNLYFFFCSLASPSNTSMAAFFFVFASFLLPLKLLGRLLLILRATLFLFCFSLLRLFRLCIFFLF